MWDAIPAYVDQAPLSSSEERVLRLAAELGGSNTGFALAELLAGLDDGNARLVLDAIAHALRLDAKGSRR